MTRPIVDVRDVPLGEKHDWRKVAGFVCATCGGPALVHPDTNQVWGCEVCERITDSPGVFFEEKIISSNASV